MGPSFVVIDGHGVVRAALIKLLGSELDAVCVGDAGTAAAGLERVVETGPELVLLDVGLPDRDGIELCRELAVRVPATPVVALTTADDAGLSEALFAAGVAAFVPKRVTGSEFIAAIRAVLDGDRRIRAGEAPTGPEVELTGRERQVLRLIAGGHTNQETATKLGLSVRTVETHRASLVRKLGTQRRSDLARLARRWGLAE